MGKVINLMDALRRSGVAVPQREEKAIMSFELTTEELDCILESLALAYGILERTGDTAKARFAEKLAARLIGERDD